MPFSAGARGSLAGQVSVPVVGFISGAEIYNTASTGNGLASGSYTPPGSASTVVVAIMGKTEFNDAIPSLAVTLDGNSPTEAMTFNATSSNDQFVWLGRWAGAPSGILSITAGGSSNNYWSSLLAYGISLDTLAEFGDSFSVDDSGNGTSTGQQTVTSTKINALLIHAVSVNWENTNTTSPNGTHTYTERYEADTGGGSSRHTIGTVGTKDMATIASYSVQTDWVTSEPWACKGVELKAV